MNDWVDTVFLTNELSAYREIPDDRIDWSSIVIGAITSGLLAYGVWLSYFK